jgi:hypothetical protein
VFICKILTKQRKVADYQNTQWREFLKFKVIIFLQLAARVRVTTFFQTDFHLWIFLYVYDKSDGVGKVQLSLCLTKHIWGSGDIAPHLLNLGTRWRCSGQLQTLATLIPGKEQAGGEGGPRPGMDAVANRKKFPAPVRNRSPDAQSVA